MIYCDLCTGILLALLFCNLETVGHCENARVNYGKTPCRFDMSTLTFSSSQCFKIFKFETQNKNRLVRCLSPLLCLIFLYLFWDHIFKNHLYIYLGYDRKLRKRYIGINVHKKTQLICLAYFYTYSYILYLSRCNKLKPKKQKKNKHTCQINLFSFFIFFNKHFYEIMFILI